MNLCFIRTRYVYTRRKRVKRKLWYSLERENSTAHRLSIPQPQPVPCFSSRETGGERNGGREEEERKGDENERGRERGKRGRCLLLVVSREDRPIQRREKFNFKKIPPPILSPAPCDPRTRLDTLLLCRSSSSSSFWPMMNTLIRLTTVTEKN